jgi:hypothetical protein
MDLKKVKDIAKSKGVESGKMKKAEIIKAIQRTEGNFDCFGSASESGYCDQQSCIWRKDCFSL